MSATAPLSRALRALSKALDREAGSCASVGQSELSSGNPEGANNCAIAGRIMARLSSACNEAAEDLDDQDRRARERVAPKPDDVKFSPKGKR